MKTFKPNPLNGLFLPTLWPNDVSTSNKYLGIIIHDKHQDDDDIMRYVKSLYSRGDILINRLKTCSSIKLFGILKGESVSAIYVKIISIHLGC